jgi:endoribonuclease Dicer
VTVSNFLPRESTFTETTLAAVLDMIVVERMYAKYPRADPGELTRRKMAIVSNATLGWLSVVDLQLAVHLQHNSQAIPRLTRQAMDIFRNVDVQTLLNEHWEYHPAKLLADVVESIIGAMFVDVGHDYEKVKKLVLPLIDKLLIASDTCRINCPIMELMAWAGSVGILTSLTWATAQLAPAFRSNTNVRRFVSSKCLPPSISPPR